MTAKRPAEGDIVKARKALSSTGRSASIEREASVTRSAPIDRETSAERNPSAKRNISVERNIPIERSTSAERSNPVERTASVERKAPEEKPSFHAVNPEWESGESFHADEGKRGKASWFLTKVLLTLTAFVLVCASVVLAIRYDRMRETLNHLEKERALQAKEIGEGGQGSGKSAISKNKQNRPVVMEPSDAASLTGTVPKDGKHHVYLTFDDGPSVQTGKVLDILKQYKVKATFFVVGREDAKSIALYQRIVDEGHTLAMHSYSHDYAKLYVSLDSFQEDLHRLQNLLFDKTGVWCKYYRFPGGSSNTASKVSMKDLEAYLDREGIAYFDWNVYGGDGISAEVIVKNVTANVDKYKESVILLHDAADKRATVSALPGIIEYLQSQKDTEILPITEKSCPLIHTS
ncbi:MAG: polysaccharide deacetylase [Lachnospiraceae bacterium]|nr:polysaccharide deacetylase [Lachnospiraceae bacterium]